MDVLRGGSLGAIAESLVMIPKEIRSGLRSFTGPQVACSPDLQFRCHTIKEGLTVLRAGAP
jgi:hypothetical protein